VLKKTSIALKRTANSSMDRLVAPPDDERMKGRFTGVDRDGLCKVGEKVWTTNVLVCKQVRAGTAAELG